MVRLDALWGVLRARSVMRWHLPRPNKGFPGKGSSTVRDASVFEVMVLQTQDKDSFCKKKALISITKGVLTSIGSYGRKLNKTRIQDQGISCKPVELFIASVVMQKEKLEMLSSEG